MRVCYLLEGTDLWGGVKVVLEQADELNRRGVTVLVLGKGPRPRWYPLEAPFRRVSEFSRETIPETDFIVATFWTTVEPAVRSGRGTVVHLCQGYEGDLSIYRDRVDAIESAYRLPTLKVAVSPHLAAWIRRRFRQEAACIGQTLDHSVFFPAPPAPFPDTPCIILVGIYEAESKGIRQGLEALDLVRAEGYPFELTRVSQFPRTEEEKRHAFPGRYLMNVPAKDMGAVYRSCHLCLSPTTGAEGFGLPAVEAMACGLPCVCTRSPALWDLDPAKDFALFVPIGKPVRMAEALIRLMRDGELRSRLSARGREVAGRFSTETTVSRLLELLRGFGAGGE